MMLKGGGAGLSYPTSVIATGTQLAYGLGISGTGPRTTPLKPPLTDATTVHSELYDQGVRIGTNAWDVMDFPPGTMVNGFDFTLGAFGAGNREMETFGTSGANVQFNDCRMKSGGSRGAFTVGSLSGGRYQVSNTVGVNFNYCDMGYLFQAATYGPLSCFRCSMHDAPNWYGHTILDAGAATPGSVVWDQCLITGGAKDPDAVHTHFELFQHISNGNFLLRDSLIDMNNIRDIWPYTDPETAWTGILSFAGGASQTYLLQRSIIRGLYNVNAVRPDAHNKITACIAYNDAGATSGVWDSMVVEAGLFGYGLNLNGGGNRPTITGAGVRDYVSNATVTL
jgi:hypothetical protein